MIEMTIGQMIEYEAEMYPEQDALVAPYLGIRYSHKQLNEICDQIAKGFLGMGIKKGDHIAIWSTNYPEWIISQISAAKIGAVLVTVNTNYKKFEIEYLLRQSDTSTLIMMEGQKENSYAEHIYALCPELKESKPGKLNAKNLPRLKNVIFLDKKEMPGMFAWDDIYGYAKSIGDEEYEIAKSKVDIYDVANMQYTSGTTGFPKGVMLTHHNLLNNGKAIGDCMKFTPQDRLLIHVPLFHCFGTVLGFMASITHGTTVVLNDHFNPVQALEIVEMEKCTAMHGVPTMFISMLKLEDFDKYDLSSLRTGIMAGSPCPIEVMKQVIDQMGIRDITITYGLTESSPAITMTTTDDPIEKRVNTIGRPIPYVETKLVNPDTGKEITEVGVPGEIMCRGYNVMKGYYNMPEATKQAIESDGWLHTGDLGTRDEDGYYKVTGRLKDMIIRGGENVYPREIEEYLYTHDAVEDVQVVGVPDEKYGEEVLACVIKKDGKEVSEEELMSFVVEGLSKFKSPRYIRFVSEFPMTASGKIQKFKLREWAIDALNLQEAASVETA
ncbi:MAG: AMP-binding protein [Christensenellaceae bacterium]|jgi:fatty-acyl-CoA synthase